MRLCLVSLMIACLAGCDRGEPKGKSAGNDGWVPVTPASQPASSPSGGAGAWPIQRIVEDPDGYRRWWEEQTAALLEKEKARLGELEGHRAAFERSWQTLTVNVTQAESLRDRLRQARDTAASTPVSIPPRPALFATTSPAAASPATTAPTASANASAPAPPQAPRQEPRPQEPRPLRVLGRNVDPARVPVLLERLDAYVRQTRQLANRARELADAYQSRLAATQFNLDRIERLKERALVEIALVKEAGSSLAVDFEALEKQLTGLDPTTRAASPDLVTLPPGRLPTTLPTTQPIEPTTTEDLLDLQ